MSKRHFLLLSAALLAAALLLVLPGCASWGYHGAVHTSYGHHPQWAYGPAFRVGPSYFTVVYGSTGYAPGYYFRSRYLGPGRYCNRACFTRGRHHYHSASCGHLRGYVSRYGYRVGYLVDRYAPRPYR